jgi:hypothetical protein
MFCYFCRDILLDIITVMHINNKNLKSVLKLQNLCMGVIVANKKAFCIIAAQTETNPMDTLCKAYAITCYVSPLLCTFKLNVSQIDVELYGAE